MTSETIIAASDQSELIKDKAGHWQQHIEAWQTSELTQPAYCQQQKISLATFGYWRTRLKKQPITDGSQDSSVRFLPVQLATQHSSVTLRTPQGISIDLSDGFDPVLLKHVLKILGVVQ